MKNINQKQFSITAVPCTYVAQILHKVVLVDRANFRLAHVQLFKALISQVQLYFLPSLFL